MPDTVMCQQPRILMKDGTNSLTSKRYNSQAKYKWQMLYLGLWVYPESIPDTPAPQGPLTPPKHVMAGLISEQDRPAACGSVAQQHCFLLAFERPQQWSL